MILCGVYSVYITKDKFSELIMLNYWFLSFLMNKSQKFSDHTNIENGVFGSIKTIEYPLEVT